MERIVHYWLAKPAFRALERAERPFGATRSGTCEIQTKQYLLTTRKHDRMKRDMSQSQSGATGGAGTAGGIESPRVETPGYDDAGQGAMGAVPSLEQRTVSGIFDTVRQANIAADAVRQAGYSADDVSVVQQEEGAAPAQSAEQTKAGKGSITGAAIGALIGGALGVVASAVTDVVNSLPGGAVAAVAGGAIAGGAIAALVGSFAGLGTSTTQAKVHEEAVRAGGFTVIVKTPDETAAADVIALLKRHGATSPSSYQPAL